ncbi:MAG TPA: hypothetical protein VGN88_07860, partial [Phycisphaerae bacterium]
MLIRIIDYIGNPGGGVRFTLEMVRAWLRISPEIEFELVSEGAALNRYTALFEEADVSILIRSVAAECDEWSYRTPSSVLGGDADVIWFPWMHRHQVPDSSQVPVVASLHDVIMLEMGSMFRGMVEAEALEKERKITGDWLASDAMIVTSSQATVHSLQRLFGIAPERCQTVPISGSHADIHSGAEPSAEWGWAKEPFLICPANISPHKNHEVLFDGVAQWGAKMPLVLTGQATHLHACKWSRAVELRDYAEKLGLTLGEKLITLGYVSDPTYYGILNRAWALIMPTLGEGGGSFPVAEA